MNGIKFVSVSDDAGTDVYGNKLKYQVILNGLDTKAYRYSEENRVAYRNAFEISEKSKVGITVARLMPIKNYKKVLDICALGIPKYFDKFFIIGDGPEKDKIKKFIVENNLQGSVYLLGERTDINALLSMADFMLLTSFSEGLSISVLEAQAAGVIPIVSKGVPEITNITKKVKYLDISERDEVWLHTILEVLDEDVDRKNMNNILLNSQYSKASFLNQIEELYA
jgi:glycosyltransferase involved in cell wall biosynthesis